jgi:hypothetical protein
MQVKVAGSKYCSRRCAGLAQRKQSSPLPGAKAAYYAAHQRALDDAMEQLRESTDDVGRVPLTAVRSVLSEALERRWSAGYATALQRRRFSRLRLSRSVIDEFLGSRFGSAFVTGELSPEALAGLSFSSK